MITTIFDCSSQELIKIEAKAKGDPTSISLCFYILDNIRKSCAENERLNAETYVNRIDRAETATNSLHK